MLYTFLRCSGVRWFQRAPRQNDVITRVASPEYKGIMSIPLSSIGSASLAVARDIVRDNNRGKKSVKL
jgi:hypothetical protein